MEEIAFFADAVKLPDGAVGMSDKTIARKGDYIFFNNGKFTALPAGNFKQLYSIITNNEKKSYS
jgi:hypothetical protein